LVQKLGVADAAARMKQSVESSVTGSMSEDEYDGYRKVGKRKRDKQKREASGVYGSRGDNGGRVPADRAIVPAALGQKKVWER